MRIPRCSFAVAALALTAGLAQGSPEESLGEVARRNREKQKGVSRPARVYTVEDLRVRDSNPPQSEASAPAGEDAASTSELDRERDERRALEEKWRARFDQARQRIKEAESRAWRTVIRPVVVGGTASGMIAGKAVIVPMAVREFVETEELRAARKGLEDLEEELRRAGLPPGWGRER